MTKRSITRLRRELSSALLGAFATLLMISAGLLVMGYSVPPAPQLAPAPLAEVQDDDGLHVPVLCHHFLRRSAGPLDLARILSALFLNVPVIGHMGVWTQTTWAFEQQMRFLYDNGYESVSIDDLIRYQSGEGTLPARPVVITFDDGDRSVLTHAVPLLKKYGFKATLFAVTGKVGENWQSVRGMTWQELRELRNTGVFSIESHTHDMHYKVKTVRGTLPIFLATSAAGHQMTADNDWREYVYWDLVRSRQALQRELGSEARYLAWPYGFGNAAVDSIALAAGFQGICTLRPGGNLAILSSRMTSLPALANGLPPALTPAKNDWSPLRIQRYTITARTSIRTFKKMLAQR